MVNNKIRVAEWRGEVKADLVHIKKTLEKLQPVLQKHSDELSKIKGAYAVLVALGSIIGGFVGAFVKGVVWR